MASSVFFKFKSQKEPQRATFDGTGISVFELKREIINISRLGDGADFDLLIYNADSNEEYDDDTTLIPRSTTVTARRVPASKPGQGRAARYVSGKMPAAARNSHRIEQTSVPAAPSKAMASTSQSAPDASSFQTEDEQIAAMLRVGADQWEQEKQNMASATPVFRQGAARGGKPLNVPDHPPPPGYVCYRCGQKGHWIQVCPTNNDPEWNNKPRVKRTTGIPRTFLQTIEKPTALANDGLTDDTRQPSSVMINADGDYVVAVPDQASWNQYKAKAEASAAQKDVAATSSKELEERGLQCPIDNRLFVDPVKTPCCGKIYCNECIENALVNSDLVCPGCSTEGVLFDNLVPDEETVAKIKAYEEEKITAASKPSEETNKIDDSSSEVVVKKEKSKSPALDTSSKSGTPTSTTTETSKKRRAEEELPNDRKSAGPPEIKKTESSVAIPTGPKKDRLQVPPGIDKDFVEQMNALAGQQTTTTNNMNMPFPNTMGMGPMMGMDPSMMNPQMMNQMMMMNPMMLQQQMRMGMGMNMPNMNMGMYPQWNGNANGNGMQYPQQNNWQGGAGFNNNGVRQAQAQQQNGNLSQQPMAFGNTQSTDDDDNAYMRKPVNPHRHPPRQRKIRPTDYREL